MPIGSTTTSKKVTEIAKKLGMAIDNGKENGKPKSFADYFPPETQVKPPERMADFLTNMKIEIASETKLGKTHFGCTFPNPVFIDFDITGGTEKAIKWYLKQEKMEGRPVKNIRRKQAYVPMEDPENPNRVKIDAIASLELLEELSALKYPSDVKTIVIENASAIWTAVQEWLYHPLGYQQEMADPKWGKRKLRYNKAKEPMQYNWGFANRKITDIFYNFLIKDCHVIVTHTMTEVYNDQGKRTGRLKPSQFKKSPHWYDFSMVIEKDADGKAVATIKTRYQVRRDVGYRTMQIEDVTYDKLVERCTNLMEGKEEV